MSAITMTVEYQGRTYPLSRMGWYQVRPDGVTIGVVVAATSTRTLTTPEQAREFTHDGKRRAIAKDVCTYELAPLDEVHERMGAAIRRADQAVAADEAREPGGPMTNTAPITIDAPTGTTIKEICHG